MVSCTPRKLFARGRATVLIEQEARSAPEVVWALWSRENYLASVSVRPVRRQVLTTLVRLLGKVTGTRKSFIYSIDFSKYFRDLLDVKVNL